LKEAFDKRHIDELAVGESESTITHPVISVWVCRFTVVRTGHG
jgi:hypothetical protein